MSEGAQKKEEKPRKFQAIRGTRDLLPPDTALWNHVGRVNVDASAARYVECRKIYREESLGEQ